MILSDLENISSLPEILQKEIRVLDHGFVRVVDHMGGDHAVVQAARVSYGKGTKTKRDDRGLVRYLLRNKHTTPFEMAELKLHVKLPIFVARQWIRHRTASVNEYSARYSVLDNLSYTPELSAITEQSTSNKQGRGRTLSESSAKNVQKRIQDSNAVSYENYRELLGWDDTNSADNDEGPNGVARELARTTLNLAFYTEWYWKIDLHNLLHFIELRIDTHAQFEIREYAKVLLAIVKLWTPMTYEAFCDYRLNSATFSGPEMTQLRALLKGKSLPKKVDGLSKREIAEFLAKTEMDG